jgi:hypothetical protein
MRKHLKKILLVLGVISCFVIPVGASTCNDCAFTGSKSMSLPIGRSGGWTAKHGCAKSIYIVCKLQNGTMYTSQGHTDSKSFSRTYSNTTVVAGSMTGKSGGSSYNVTVNKCNPCKKSSSCKD